MSLIKHPLNAWLRLTEKPHLARATPQKARRSLEVKARLFFHPPFGTRFEETTLTADGRVLPAVQVTTKGAAAGPLILYFHGGGFVFGSPRTHRAMVAWLSRYTGWPACLPRYRLGPENPFPAAIDDALAAYLALADHPGGVVLGGDSAGGALALALLARITAQGLPQPLGTFAFSPLTDLTFSGESVVRNADADVEMPAKRAGEMAEAYLNGADPRDPLASPLYGDFTGVGPVWLTVGDTEILLDDTRRMAERLTAQGVDVTCTVEDNLPHVWPIFCPVLPEARATLRNLATWIKALSRRKGES